MMKKKAYNIASVVDILNFFFAVDEDAKKSWWAFPPW